MKRRLYFLFSDTGHARSAVADLAGLGVDAGHMHVLARPGTDLSGLPPATERQRRDFLMRLENTLWGGNLVLFGLAFAGLVLAAVFGSVTGMVLAAAVLIASFTSGALFALRMPMVHLDEFHEALRHGELLLMVDVSRDCMEDVEELLRRRHPEAVAGGSAWTPDAFGV
jgi:cobalamin biosynthesis protein CobD/CbiB